MLPDNLSLIADELHCAFTLTMLYVQQLGLILSLRFLFATDLFETFRNIQTSLAESSPQSFNYSAKARKKECDWLIKIANAKH